MYGNNCKEHAELKLDDFLVSSLVVKDDISGQLEKIANGTVKSNNNYTIQKSLEIIAKFVEKQKSNGYIQ